MRLERVRLFEACGKRLVVVDFAVDRQSYRVVRAHQRLRPALHIHDGQPLMGQNRVASRIDASPVRTTVPLKFG